MLYGLERHMFRIGAELYEALKGFSGPTEREAIHEVVVDSGIKAGLAAVEKITSLLGRISIAAELGPQCRLHLSAWRWRLETGQNKQDHLPTTF